MWLLMGKKSGDNNQLLALAESLGWPWEEKHLDYIPWEILPNRILRTTLLGLKRSRCDALEAPWPDLVLSAGRRNEPVARWIRRQNHGATRLVHLGRPWARPKHFDLVITTPQYDLGDAPNVIHNELPLHRVQKKRLEAAAHEWESRLKHLPRPWHALFLGGHSSSAHFTAAGVQFLARECSALAARSGGSLLVTSSARTPKGAMDIIRGEVQAPAFYYDYSPKSVPGQNPYFAFLALADVFVVTAESISMLTEACATGRGVFVYDPARGEHRGDESAAAGLTLEANRSGRRLGTWLRDHCGPRRLRRDISKIHDELARRGRIAWLGQPPASAPCSPDNEDLERARLAVRKLFDSSGK